VLEGSALEELEDEPPGSEPPEEEPLIEPLMPPTAPGTPSGLAFWLALPLECLWAAADGDGEGLGLGLAAEAATGATAGTATIPAISAARRKRVWLAIEYLPSCGPIRPVRGCARSTPWNPSVVRVRPARCR
jgi:hypothetical protein